MAEGEGKDDRRHTLIVNAITRGLAEVDRFVALSERQTIARHVGEALDTDATQQPEPQLPLRAANTPPTYIYDATNRLVSVGLTAADANWIVQQINTAKYLRDKAREARDELHRFVDEHIAWCEVDSARDGWNEGSCDLCDWTTNGSEEAVEEAAHQHAADHLAGLVTQRQETAQAAAPGLRAYALAHQWANDMPANITEDLARAILADAGRQIIAAYHATAQPEEQHDQR